jgi:ankyrin repeat protein
VIFSEDKSAPPELDFHIAIVELLLNKEVDVDYKGGYFGTALQAAVHSDEPKIVQLLLNAGARVTEDGDGFYGGYLSAAISFGKRTMKGVKETIGYKTNAAQILEMLLDHTTSQDFPAMATSAIARAREKSNDEGLEVLKTAISQHSAYRGLVGKLFS